MQTQVRFDITPVDHLDGRLVLRLSGELDLATVPALAAAVDHAIAASDAAIVLDLTELAFLDACGLRGLSRAGHAAEAAHRSLSLRGSRGLPQRVLRLAGLEEQMATVISDVMAPRPVAVPPTAPLGEVAQLMRDSDIGDVIVQQDGRLTGIVTDRDIVVRAIADERALQGTNVGDICSRDLVTIRPDEPIERAVQLMREAAIRRLPVADNGQLVGVVSLGDLALERDPSSCLADISAAEPNQ